MLTGLNRSSSASQTTTEHILRPAIWQSTYPSPVYDGVLADPTMDLCLDLAKRKKLFTSRLETLKHFYRKNKSASKCDDMTIKRLIGWESKFLVIVSVVSELSQIPRDNANVKTVKNFAETLEMDPDKYFNGTYNWYLTGSGMDIVNVNGQEFLIHSDGNLLQNLSKLFKLA